MGVAINARQTITNASRSTRRSTSGCGLLRELRHEAGLTQVQVAERLEVPQSFVSRYESGERRLDVVELGHVAGALNLSVRDVLDRLDGQEPGHERT